MGGMVRSQELQLLLQDLLLLQTGFTSYLQAVADIAAENLKDTVHNGVLLGIRVTDQQQVPVTVVAGPGRVDHRIASLDPRHHADHVGETGEGGNGDLKLPSIPVAVHRVYIRDTSTDHEYPSFSRAARELSVGSVIDVMLPIDGAAQVSFALYSTSGGALTPQMMWALKSFAVTAAKPLMLAMKLARLARRAEELTTVMHERTIIDLAIGAIMAKERCTNDQATRKIMDTARNRNLPARDVASAILDAMNTGKITTYFDH